MPKQEILSAFYGINDIQIEVTDKIKNNNFLKITNNLVGYDPMPNHVKKLKVVYYDGTDIKEKVFKENEIFFLGSTYKKLGIFYTNNKVNKKIIKNSLKSIEIAAENKAEIIYCGWEDIEDFNFTKIICDNKQWGHFNICYQILKALYLTKKCSFEDVYFLEHDVLYPPDYFDGPKIAKIECNMNYIGMNQKGYQPLNQKDQPLHELSMDFEFALSHFEKTLLNFMEGTGFHIEPQCHNEYINRYTSIPSIHMNQSVVTTSHYNIYGKADKTSIDYWGDFTNHYPPEEFTRGQV